MRLSVLPIIVGFIACIPLGWLATRYRAARGFLLTLGGVLFTIPSLALFVALPGILGTKILDERNVVVALSIYAVAIMVRGAADAFAAVSSPVLESATAVGYSALSRFWTVELPLAGPVLLANLRVVSVSTVSLLSVAALIGKGGLGYLFLNGYQRDFPTEVMIGIVFTLGIALAFDVILVQLGRVLLPWAHSRLPRSPEAALS
ncbi:MAG TPA: ABC transporter permease subunit [Terrimesophilobacter sp.]|uniref:ABC transporter permease n=1 Tax=Terrimesophilobacter sp. TaxID=2906435 RepID=UPI002F91FB9D